MTRTDFLKVMTLGTYRRLDGLDVPVFRIGGHNVGDGLALSSRDASVHPLATNITDQSMSFADYVAGRPLPHPPPSTKLLSTVFRHFVAPHTYEPGNVYPIHRPVPSVRCLFPYSVRLVVADAESGRSKVYGYQADFHALEYLHDLSSEAEFAGDAKVAIVVVAQPWVIAAKYGEFAGYPVSLECGMLRAHLKHVLNLTGVTSASVGGDAAHWNQVLRIDSATESVVFAQGIELRSDALSVLHTERVRISAVRRRPLRDPVKAYPKLPQVWRWNRTASRPVSAELDAVCKPAAVTESDAPLAHTDMYHVLRRRNSGNDAVGFSPSSRHLPGDFLAQLVSAWRGIRCRRSACGGEAFLSPKLAWLHPACGRPGVYNEDLTLHETGLSGVQLARLMRQNLPNPTLRYNMAAVALDVMIVADLEGAYEALGDSAFRDLHMAAGSMAHDFCIAASGFEMFARPVRMYTELGIEASFGLPGYLIYQVLAGFNRATNLEVGLL